VGVAFSVFIVYKNKKIREWVLFKSNAGLQ